MINIIKDNTKTIFYTICKKCKSELSYTYEDVTFEKIPYFYGSIGAIICPVCNAATLAELRDKEDYNDNSFTFNPSTLPIWNNCCCEGDKNV